MSLHTEFTPVKRVSMVHVRIHIAPDIIAKIKLPNSQCWASYFVKVTSYILLATELFNGG